MEEFKKPEEPLTLDQEYDLWKSNVPLMYDFFSETELVWPTLTVQWLPSSGTNAIQKLITGTHTSDGEQNYLKVVTIHLPSEVTSNSESKNKIKSNIKVNKKFPHEGEVVRARYMPTDPNVVATINGNGKIFIYDCSKNKNEALLSTLEYHKENGYGLAFNPNTSNELLSGSDDSNIALWDIDKKKPVSLWTDSHDDIVNDCKWHEFDKNIFGSVSDDSKLILHDKRSAGKTLTTINSKSAFNTLAFSKHSENLFAASGTDKSVYLYDRRNCSKALHSMAGHDEAVTSLEFYNQNDGILVSSGSDRRIILWDLSEIGAEQQPDEAEDGPPEIMMMHAGHKSSINDFSLHPTIPWLTASVEEENTLQVWQASKKLPKVGGTPTVDLNMLR